MNEGIKLTSFSHGAGCGCKISPKVLTTILASSSPQVEDSRLLVGNDTRDDAAVYDMGSGIGIISTTDFFMPIVDDPYIWKNSSNQRYKRCIRYGRKTINGDCNFRVAH